MSSRCSTSNVAASVLDGSAVLWVVHWPAKGVIADFVENFKGSLLKKLLESDVYLIFDRYSTKSVTTDACESSSVYQLTENTPVPSQKAVLTVSSNKKQLMSIICSSIINDEEFHAQHTTRNKLIIHSGATVPIVADDTDVFILLLFHYLNERLTCPMFMGSPIQQRSLIDIKATVQAHRSIIRGLPAAHALSGCDTVPTYFGIGKGTVLKNLIAAPNSLSWFGCLDAPGLLRCAFI